jgi:GAF domain-containing protein
MGLLQQVHLDFITTFDSRQILKTALARSIQMVDAPRGSIMLFDSHVGALRKEMGHEAGKEYEVGEGRIYPLDVPSVARWVLENNEARLCPNVNEDPVYNPRWSSKSREAMLCIPIQSGDIAIGVICADSDYVGYFTEEHQQILSRLVAPVGFAIERASLIESLKDLSSATGDRERLLSAIAESVVQLVHVPACLVWLVDERTSRLGVGAHIGFEEDMTGFQLNTADLFVRMCVESFRSEKQPLYAANAQKIEGHPSAKAQELGLVSVLAAPLLAGGELVGMTGAYTREPRQFSGWSKRLMGTLAGQAAVAVENTRLMEAQGQRLALLEKEPGLLRRVRLAMDSALDLDTILDLILREGIMKGLGSKVVSANIMLYNREERLLEMTALVWPGVDGTLMLEKKKGRVFRLGKGVAGHVFLTKQPCIVPDITKDDRFEAIQYGTDKCALLTVPVLSGTAVLGVINADGKDVGCFTEDEKLWLTALADYVAAAIERVTLLESLKELKKSIADEERLLECIAKGICDLLHVTGSLVWLRVKDGGALTIAASEGEDRQRVDEWRLDEDDAFVQKCLQLFEEIHEPLSTKDARQDPHFPYHQAAGSVGIVSMLTIPLLDEQGLRGLITAYSGEVREFTARQCDSALTFAEQAAIAIDHARLYHETEQRLQVMQAVREISFAVASQAELPTILQLIVERAVDLLGGKGGLIYLFEETTQELEVAVGQGLGKDYKGVTLALGKGLAGKVYASKESLIVHDYSTWPERSPKWAGEGVTSVIGVPLFFENTRLGVIEVMADREKRTFAQDDADLLELFAQQACVAIEMARRRDDLLAAEAVASLAISASDLAHQTVQKGAAIKYEVVNLRDVFIESPLHPETDVKVQAFLDGIEAAAAEVRSMALARQMVTQPQLAPQSVPIDDALTAQFTARCKRRPNVELQISLNCLKVRVRIDEESLKIVLHNLISNAFDAMPNGGTLTVSSERRGKLVEIRVTDTGTGIDPAVRRYLLQRRVPKAEGEPGTGMGILMGRFILRKYGGELRLPWSREGEGTCISLTIPAVED